MLLNLKQSKAARWWTVYPIQGKEGLLQCTSLFGQQHQTYILRLVLVDNVAEHTVAHRRAHLFCKRHFLLQKRPASPLALSAGHACVFIPAPPTTNTFAEGGTLDMGAPFGYLEAWRYLDCQTLPWGLLLSESQPACLQMLLPSASSLPPSWKAHMAAALEPCRERREGKAAVMDSRTANVNCFWCKKKKILKSGRPQQWLKECAKPFSPLRHVCCTVDETFYLILRGLNPV